MELPAQLGDAKCAPCTSHPSHRIIPCRHSICYDHLLLGHDQESRVSSLCAKCGQSVLNVVEIVNKPSDASDQPLAPSYLSPTRKTIWSPQKQPPSSDKKPEMRPNADPREWGHSEFVPRTPPPFRGDGAAFAPPPPPPLFLVDQSSMPQQYAQQSYQHQPDMYQNYTQQPAVYQQQFPQQQIAQQRVDQPRFVGNQTVVNPHDPQFDPYAHISGSKVLDPQNFSSIAERMGMQPHHGQQDPFVDQAAPIRGPHALTHSEPHGVFDRSQGKAKFTPNPSISTPVKKHVAVSGADTSTPAYVSISPPDDTTLSGTTALTLSAGNNAVIKASEATTVSSSGPLTPEGTATDGSSRFTKPIVDNVKLDRNSAEYKAEAKRLAAAIMAGLAEDPASSKTSPMNKQRRGSLHPRRGSVASQSGALVLHQPVMYQPMPQQTFVMPAIEPDPPFFAAYKKEGRYPTADEAFHHIPFYQPCAMSKPAEWGVIKITNIPYTTTKNEVLASIGRNARIVQQPQGTPYYGIHIIMDRPTGKTMDCYVEMVSHAEALSTFKHFQHRFNTGRPPKIGDRHIDISLSSQAELMANLFPRASCINWSGQTPVLYETDNPYNSGYHGFLTSEEMTMTCKHAETPSRSPFAQRVFNRCYESIISTLHKYPWHALEYVSLAERNVLFTSTLTCIKSLMRTLRRGAVPSIYLNRQLLAELICAGLTNPGFTHVQHTAICDTVERAGFPDLLGTVPFTKLGNNLATYWPFEVLNKKPTASSEMLEWYVMLLRQATMPQATSLYEIVQAGNRANVNPFGDLKVEYAGNPKEISMKQAGMAEWNVLDNLIRAMLSSASARSSPQKSVMQGES